MLKADFQRLESFKNERVRWRYPRGEETEAIEFLRGQKSRPHFPNAHGYLHLTQGLQILTAYWHFRETRPNLLKPQFRKSNAKGYKFLQHIGKLNLTYSPRNFRNPMPSKFQMPYKLWDHQIVLQIGEFKN